MKEIYLVAQEHQSCNQEISQHAIPLRPEGESHDSKKGRP
jgi:hypothetical protein